MKPTSLALLILALLVATVWPISSAIGAASARAEVSRELAHVACPDPAARDGAAPGPRALPPGHPPLGALALPPGHPPVDGLLPPGHPPIGPGAPRTPPGHPPIPSTHPPASPAAPFGAPVLLDI